MPTDEARDAAQRIAAECGADVFLYNGVISRSHDLGFIQCIADNKRHDSAILFLITEGGDPDAAYKLARYIQERFEKFTVVVSGTCKSAGTLIAVGAHEIAFSPYGELGPIDVQTYIVDNLAERQSGLTITEALDNLTNSAVRKHGETFSAIIHGTGAVVSFQTASAAATDLVHRLFVPIFAQIDPYDVGKKARAMRIATDYGRRLAARTGNLQDRALDTLTQTYPSHSFVIDMAEAERLFRKVRPVTDAEAELIHHLGILARVEARATGDAPTYRCLSRASEENQHVPREAEPRHGQAGNGPDPDGATGETAPPTRGTGPGQPDGEAREQD